MHRTVRNALLALAFTFLSSWFGLTGRIAGGLPLQPAVEFFASIWGSSLLADAVFAGGSFAAGYAVLHILDTRRPSLTGLTRLAGASLFANWLVYVASFLLLPVDRDPLGIENVLDAVWFVVSVGLLGLLFCFAAPFILAAILRRAEAGQAGSQGAEPPGGR